MFSGLEWTFPISEISGYLPEHMALIMPLLLLILGVLLALLVLEGLSDILLRVVAFVVGAKTGLDGHPGHSMDLGLEGDDRELD